MCSSFTPIGDALTERIRKQAPLKKNLETAQILEIACAVFEEHFSSDAAIFIKPLFLKNRTLTVTCANSAIAQEIRINQPAIVAKINQKLGKNEVDRIRYLA